MIVPLLEYVFQNLSLDWRVYHSRAIGTPEDPIPKNYIVYKLPSTSSTVHRDDRILEVNFWCTDNDGDLIELELMVQKVAKHLRGRIHIDKNHLLVFKKIGELAIPDPDPAVERRELRYVIKQSERIDR